MKKIIFLVVVFMSCYVKAAEQDEVSIAQFLANNDYVHWDQIEAFLIPTDPVRIMARDVDDSSHSAAQILLTNLRPESEIADAFGKDYESYKNDCREVAIPDQLFPFILVNTLKAGQPLCNRHVENYPLVDVVHQKEEDLKRVQATVGVDSINTFCFFLQSPKERGKEGEKYRVYFLHLDYHEKPLNMKGNAKIFKNMRGFKFSQKTSPIRIKKISTRKIDRVLEITDPSLPAYIRARTQLVAKLVADHNDACSEIRDTFEGTHIKKMRVSIF